MGRKFVCVFCGCRFGSKPEYAQAARELTEEMARRGLGLVSLCALLHACGLFDDLLSDVLVLLWVMLMWIAICEFPVYLACFCTFSKVYGGGTVGIMGEVAKACYEKGLPVVSCFACR